MNLPLDIGTSQLIFTTVRSFTKLILRVERMAVGDFVAMSMSGKHTKGSKFYHNEMPKNNNKLGKLTSQL